MKIIDKILKDIKLFASIRKGGDSYVKNFEKGNIWWGGTDKVADPYRQMSDVFMAITAIVENAPQAKIVFRDRDTDEAVEDQELMKLFATPNPLMTYREFIEACSGFYCIHGEVFIIKTFGEGSVRQRAGFILPNELIPVKPTRVRPEIDKNTTELLGWWVDRQFFYPEEIIHIKSFNNNNPLRGFSRLKPIENEMDISWKALLFNKAFFDNAGTPSLHIGTDEIITPDQQKQLEEWIDKNFKGASKGFKTIVTGGGMKVSNIASNHKDMDFIEQNKMTTTKILGMWRVPKSVFSITDDLNYATAKEQKRLFWEDTVKPMLDRFGESFNKDIVFKYNPRTKLIFDLSNIPAFKEAMADKVDLAIKLQQLGYTSNQINQKLELGMPENEWQDTWWKPFSTVDVNEEPMEIDSQDNSDKQYSGAKIQNIPVEEIKEDTFKIKKVSEKDIKTSDKKEKEEKHKRLGNNFLKRHKRVERMYASKIQTFFFNQRKAVLGSMEKSIKAETKNINIEIDWAEQDTLLQKKVNIVNLLAIQEGISYVRDLPVVFPQTPSRIELNFAMSAVNRNLSNRITMINRTMQRQIEVIVQQGISEGLTTEETADKIRQAYNLAKNRATTIARTQTTAAMNNSGKKYAELSGAKTKEWITAGDELVRESHVENQLQGEIPLTQNFSNGQDYPGEPVGDPAESINCRCTLGYE